MQTDINFHQRRMTREVRKNVTEIYKKYLQSAGHPEYECKRDSHKGIGQTSFFEILFYVTES